jgi:hypothetical protein
MAWRAFLSLALAALPLASCGAGGEADAVRDSIRTAFTSTDPSACTTRQTPEFVRQGTLGLPRLAVEYERFCAANIRRLTADSVEISEVSVDGARARARFSAAGGAYPIRAATVTLRRIDRRWLLHRLTSLNLDRASFDRLQLELATQPKNGLSRGSAGCLVRRLRTVETARLESAIVAADASLLADPVLLCAVRPDLRAAGFTVAQTSCVIARLRERRGTQLVRLLLAGTPAARRELQRRIGRAAAACTS